MIILISSVIVLIIGIFSIKTTRSVMGTHFVTTKNEIFLVNNLGSIKFTWDEIIEAIIRERKWFKRPDRVVILRNVDNNSMGLNTSILSLEDEEILLKKIENNIKCPIKRINKMI